MAAAGEAAEEVEVMRQLPGSESAAESEVVPEPVSGEGQIREQVVAHREAGLTVESGVEADARADAEGVAEVAEEERPAAGPARTGPATTEEAECAPDVDNSATYVGQGESVALGEDMGEGGGEGGATDPEGGTMGGGRR